LAFIMEMVASFENRSHLSKSWEKTDTCAVSSYGTHGPKKRSDHAHSRPIRCHGVPPFFCPYRARMTLLPYTLAHARSFGVTENSQPLRSVPITGTNHSKGQTAL